MTSNGYQGIVFPGRAEDLSQDLYASYRVFLDHWDDLSEKIRFRYQNFAMRRTTNAVLIYGPQGSGKSMLASQLVGGHASARSNRGAEADASNLWHRITGGRTLDPALINSATQNTVIHHIEDDVEWVQAASTWHTNNPQMNRIVVVDNAERAYFRQGLLQISTEEFLRLGNSDEAIRMAAEKFVALCRTELRPALFLLLTNNDVFATNFTSAVEDQHENLVSVELLPFPSNKAKETVVRINTNRLNPISYWYCLDRAGRESRRSVRTALQGAETFPGTFSAVDNAIASSERTGRAANSCLLSLVVLADMNELTDDADVAIGERWEKRCFSSDIMRIETYSSGWASSVLEDARQASLLESEWKLRIITMANPIIYALFEEGAMSDRFAHLIELLSTVHGTGTHDATLEDYWSQLEKCVDGFTRDIDTAAIVAFWAKGQVRSHDYEGRLRQLLSAYDVGAPGFLGYRPDYVVEPYRPCSLVSAVSSSDEAIKEALKRSTHVFEFTAIRDLSPTAVLTYLEKKAPNYVALLEGQ